MSEIKFTTDGKKVIVLSALNSQEMIVQEIFVTETGQEFPGGENFVVKSLLDQPAKTWKQKEVESWEKRYESERREWDLKIENQRKKLKSTYEILYAHLQIAGKNLKEVSEESFEFAIKVLTGKVNFMTSFCSYSGWKVVDIFKEGVNCDNNLKLLTMWGRGDGTLTYKLHNYSDGSGNDMRNVNFFKTHEDVVNHIQKWLDSADKYDDVHIKSIEKYDLTADKRKLADRRDFLIDLKKKAIESKRNELLKLETELSAI